ncbi:TrkA-N domain protein [Desulfobulbus propionicus DSM 2032]|uniref:TrkA-N domain protein n=1 Tax=Desulfobulbus propionicus (strain ATCC 33891 / DSM 2032 / VKM B-1956 / 1pr3) TaxID=577650 RepID=A0A7U3YLA5_DESPD|nr:potassium channel protein [Desulfobulbus propionicus]ADW17455.1 TrkA-N domain protein [Desulfobulbus propionicus DSM 2032]
MRKVIIITVAFILLVLIGTFGYMILENTGFWMGMYLTIITVFTVGYGDIVPIHPSGRIFTVFLVITSVAFVFYTFTKITETMIEGELRGLYKRRKMNKEIARLRDHYIICGFGRIGKEICRILQEHHRPFLVIEKDEEEIRTLEELGYLRLQGDAADDEVLQTAGIERAKGLVSVVASDADNLYITLTARGLNPVLYIMARSSGGPGVQIKLKRAGASKVISPYSIGARRMAHLIVRPTVADFIDLTMRAGELDLIMEELQVGPASHLSGKNLIESEIRKKYDVIVVAIKRQDGSMLFNPKPDSVIMAGDILIVLGASEHILGLGKEM